MNKIKATFRDALHLISCLNVWRVWNGVQLLASFYWSTWRGRPIRWGQAMTVSFEPTTACNLRCPECPSGLRAFTRETGNLKKDFFTRVLDEISPRLLFLIFYFQGEPYIHPEFLEMVAAANRKKLYTITSTNGHFLSDENARKTVESGLSRLIISVDGASQEVYEQYRVGGNLQTVLEGARNLVAWKKRLNKSHPYIVFQVLVVRPNEHQLEDLRKLAKDIGVDEIKFKSAQVYDYKHGNPLIPSNKQYARYVELKDGTWKPKHALKPYCWKMWHAAVITWNGTVVPCCFDKDASHQMGTLQTTSFEAIWKGKPYTTFRETLATGRDQIDICTNCSEGCSVWV